MKTVVNVVINHKFNKPKYDATLSPNPSFDELMVIYCDGTQSYDELISNKEEINKALEKALFGPAFDDIELATSYEQFVDNIEYISLQASHNDYNEEYQDLDYTTPDLSREEVVEVIHEYIKEHPEYKNKKILIPDIIELNTDLEEIKKIYDGIEDLLVLPEGQSDPIEIDRAKVGNELYDTINVLKKLELSPLEYAIIGYDLVRDKVYKFEESDEIKAESRDPYRALTGDAIVCAGYARIYETIMNQLGVPCREITLDSTVGDAGHARNSIYINDEKYGVKGIFICDATPDSRKEDDLDNEYLYRYDWFLKKLDDFKAFNAAFDLCNESFARLDTYKIEELDKICKESLVLFSATNMDIQTALKTRAQASKTLSNIICYYEPEDLERTASEKAELIQKHEEEIIEDFKSRIEADVFTRALMYARIVENRLDDSIEFDPEKIYRNTFNYAFDFKMDKLLHYMTEEERVYNAIFGSGSFADRLDLLSEAEKHRRVRNNYATIIKKWLSYAKEETKDIHKVVGSLSIYSKGDSNVKK